MSTTKLALTIGTGTRVHDSLHTVFEQGKEQGSSKRGRRPRLVGTDSASTLLVLLRGARPRLDVARHGPPTPGTVRRPLPVLLERILRPVRYTLIQHVPVRVSRSTLFLLDGRGHATSKTGIAANELLTAGAAPKAIFPPVESFRPTKLVKYRRTLARLPRAVVLDLYLRRRAPGLTDVDASLIIARDAFSRFFVRHPWVCPIVNSDVSPRRALLAAGASRAGVRSLYWQDDFDSFHTDPPLLGFGYAAVLNREGALGISRRYPDAAVYSRESLAPCPTRLTTTAPRVGVALNAFFTASAEQLAALSRAVSAVGADSVEVRLHPRSEVDARALDREWIEVAPITEPLAEFAKRIDLAICGNTAAQIRVLASGTPVLHVEGLDIQRFDAYGFGGMGIVFAEAAPRRGVLERLQAFYATGEHLPRLAQLLDAPTESVARPLSDFVKEHFKRFGT